MNAHFFDIDTVVRSDAKVWVVDKSKPGVCLLKVGQSDFNLIRNGVYRNQGNKITFAGTDYFLPDETMNNIKVSAKRLRANSSNLAFSMREFLDPEHIDSVNHSVDTGVLSHLKNTQDDVFFICSRKTKKAYDAVIKKVESKLEELGLVPSYYYISENFYERDEDETSFDKVRLLLQHLVGLKTDGRKFTEDAVVRYEEVYFYDDDARSVQLAGGASDMLHTLLQNSDSSVKDKVRDVVKQGPVLFANLVTPNLVSRFSTTKVQLQYSNLMKSFESFRYFGH